MGTEKVGENKASVSKSAPAPDAEPDFLRGPSIHPTVACQHAMNAPLEFINRDHIMLLQRTIGNRAVGQLLQMKMDENNALQRQQELEEEEVQAKLASVVQKKTIPISQSDYLLLGRIESSTDGAASEYQDLIKLHSKRGRTFSGRGPIYGRQLHIKLTEGNLKSYSVKTKLLINRLQSKELRSALISGRGLTTQEFRLWMFIKHRVIDFRPGRFLMILTRSNGLCDMVEKVFNSIDNRVKTP